MKIEKAEECEPSIKYRNLIGALLYVSSGTRPEISHSVKYLYLTKELRLQYKRNRNWELIDCYVDADWAGDNVDRKSTSGYVIRVFGNVIDWKFRKHRRMQSM